MAAAWLLPLIKSTVLKIFIRPHALGVALFVGASIFYSNLGVAVCPPEGSESVDEITGFLSDWDQTRQRLAITARSCFEPAFPYSAVRFEEAGRWPRGACRPYASIESVCLYARSYCRERSPDPSCWFGLGIPTPCIPEAQLLQTHRQILDYAAQRFQELTQDVGMQNHCCGNHQPCRQKWSSTRLNLILGSGASNRTAHYRRLDGIIDVSLGKLVNCTTTDCIDRIFYHELGHACVAARDRDHRTALVGFTSPRVAECIMRGLEVQRRQAVGPVDYETWISEALADSVFISRASVSPGPWAFACSVVQDEKHPSPRSYFGCYLDLASVHQNICGR